MPKVRKVSKASRASRAPRGHKAPPKAPKLPKAALLVKRRIRVYLAQNDLTQSALAEELDISAGHLSSIMKGREAPSLRVAVALENLTHLPARAFLNGGRER